MKSGHVFHKFIYNEVKSYEPSDPLLPELIPVSVAAPPGWDASPSQVTS